MVQLLSLEKQCFLCQFNFFSFSRSQFFERSILTSTAICPETAGRNLMPLHQQRTILHCHNRLLLPFQSSLLMQGWEYPSPAAQKNNCPKQSCQPLQSLHQDAIINKILEGSIQEDDRDEENKQKENQQVECFSIAKSKIQL